MDDKLTGQEKSAGFGHGILGILNLIALIEDWVLVVLLTAMILLAAGLILLRNIFDMGLAWGDPTLRALVLWVGLMGAVVASRENKHINIDVLLRFLTLRARAICQVGVGLFTAFVCALVSFHAVRFVYHDYEAGTMAFGGLPVWIVELILPFGFFLISLRYVFFTIARIKEFLTGEGGN